MGCRGWQVDRWAGVEVGRQIFVVIKAAPKYFHLSLAGCRAIWAEGGGAW